jgi:hypothetical protein
MHLGPRILLLLPLAALLSCGSSQNPSAPLTFSGNWEAVGGPIALTSDPIMYFTGSLQFNGSTVTGTLRAFTNPKIGSSPCVAATQDLQATGTLDADNNLTLTFPIAGGAATITAALGPDLQSSAAGTWQIVGGSCATASAAITIAQYLPLTGTYVGYLANGLANGSATAILTQSTTPNANGLFPLTGTIIVSGTCSGTMPMVAELVSGNNINTAGTSTPTPSAELTGTFDPTATTIQASVELFAPNCSIQNIALQSTLTRQ